MRFLILITLFLTTLALSGCSSHGLTVASTQSDSASVLAPPAPPVAPPVSVPPTAPVSVTPPPPPPPPVTVTPPPPPAGPVIKIPTCVASFGGQNSDGSVKVTVAIVSDPNSATTGQYKVNGGSAQQLNISNSTFSASPNSGEVVALSITVTNSAGSASCTYQETLPSCGLTVVSANANSAQLSLSLLTGSAVLSTAKIDGAAVSLPAINSPNLYTEAASSPAKSQYAAAITDTAGNSASCSASNPQVSNVSLFYNAGSPGCSAPPANMGFTFASTAAPGWLYISYPTIFQPTLSPSFPLSSTSETFDLQPGTDGTCAGAPWNGAFYLPTGGSHTFTESGLPFGKGANNWAGVKAWAHGGFTGTAVLTTSVRTLSISVTSGRWGGAFQPFIFATNTQVVYGYTAWPGSSCGGPNGIYYKQVNFLPGESPTTFAATSAVFDNAACGGGVEGLHGTW